MKRGRKLLPRTILADEDRKIAFAGLRLRYPCADPMTHALTVIPECVNTAARAATLWPNDPTVLAEMSRVRLDPAQRGALLSKEETARLQLDIAMNPECTFREALQALRDYSVTMGFANQQADDPEAGMNLLLELRDRTSQAGRPQPATLVQLAPLPN